ACSFNVVIQDGDALEELCLPVRTSLPIPPGGGNSTFIKPSTSVVVPGNKPWNLTATLAGRDRTISASPWTQAFTIRRAARFALMEITGRASLILNQAYSASLLLLNEAFLGVPVRMRPGHTVVT